MTFIFQCSLTPRTRNLPRSNCTNKQHHPGTVTSKIVTTQEMTQFTDKTSERKTQSKRKIREMVSQTYELDAELPNRLVENRNKLLCHSQR